MDLTANNSVNSDPKTKVEKSVNPVAADSLGKGIDNEDNIDLDELEETPIENDFMDVKNLKEESSDIEISDDSDGSDSDAGPTKPYEGPETGHYDSDMEAEYVYNAPNVKDEASEQVANQMFQLPLPEVLDSATKLYPLGKVSSIIDSHTIVIQSSKNFGNLNLKRLDPNYKALDSESVLALVNKKVVGRIFETFGPVSKPFYLVKFPKESKDKAQVKLEIHSIDLDVSKDETKVNPENEYEEASKELNNLASTEGIAQPILTVKVEDVIVPSLEVKTSQCGQEALGKSLSEKTSQGISEEQIEAGVGISNIEEKIEQDSEEVIDKPLFDQPSQNYPVGTEIYYTDFEARFVPVAELVKLKGTDASNMNDEELSHCEDSSGDEFEDDSYHGMDYRHSPSFKPTKIGQKKNQKKNQKQNNNRDKSSKGNNNRNGQQNNKRTRPEHTEFDRREKKHRNLDEPRGGRGSMDDSKDNFDFPSVLGNRGLVSYEDLLDDML